jgi:RNA polymerase sigma factor (sigma-70 family)
MVIEGQDKTSSLIWLHRLQYADDQAAWDDFARRFEPRIRGLFRRFGSTQADAEDLTQEWLEGVWHRVKVFDRRQSGSFHAWLLMIARKLHLALYRKTRRQKAQTEEQADNLTDPNSGPLWEAAARNALETAENHVQEHVNANTWQAYKRIDRETDVALAKEFGIKPASVRRQAERVRKLLHKELVSILNIDTPGVSMDS